MTIPASLAAAGNREGAERAFLRARRQFMAGDRIDMQDLAADMDVDRSTLFRWIGNRDHLLAMILISLAEPAIRAAEAQTTSEGATRIRDVARRYADGVLGSAFFQAYLRRESDRALRLLTSKASAVQAHIVTAFEELIETERRAGRLQHSMESRPLAYIVVRIIESFVYTDTITGDPPDAAMVSDAVGALMHVD
ncbi:QsdR family transcriptional regulator [Microbacterium sp. MYb64]|uniref:QsdR family transcriptional regulator n=1 Tax=Microbacterium sp. MYb64 TaxID=1848691 RepID=UPI0015E3148E|nr:QsdR family transcriptional regulator [Microbacterium sp. MYb64]